MNREGARHREHLQWALEFCQADLTERGEYLEDIKAKIYEFIRDANLQAPGRHLRQVLLPEPKVYVGELTNDHARQIQQGFKDGFLALSDQAVIVSSASTTPVGFYLGAVTPANRFFQSIVVHSDPVAQAAIAFELHLVRSGLIGEQVRKCPECGKVFIGERKGQKYCSPPCARAVANREYYERQTKKAKGRSPRTTASQKRSMPTKKTSKRRK